MHEYSFTMNNTLAKNATGLWSLGRRCLTLEQDAIFLLATNSDKKSLYFLLIIIFLVQR